MFSYVFSNAAQSLLFKDVNDLILSPMFGALIGALISLLVLCFAIIAFIRHRVCNGRPPITAKGKGLMTIVSVGKNHFLTNLYNSPQSQPLQTVLVETPRPMSPKLTK